MTMEEMEGHISMLHKGGKTSDKAGDWRPVVLLNCTNQLIMHVLNARLRDIVERADILEPGQVGGRRTWHGSEFMQVSMDNARDTETSEQGAQSGCRLSQRLQRNEPSGPVGGDGRTSQL